MTRAVAVKASPEPKPAEAHKPRWRVVVGGTAVERAPDAAPDHLPADQLSQAALLAGAQSVALPHRSRLEQAFGVGLAGVQVLSGPGAEAALDARGADAAAEGGTILLRPDAPLPVVAHEVTHVLQSRGFRPVDADFAEAEARDAEGRVAAGLPVAPVQAGLGGTVAYRMPQAGDAPSLSEPEVTATEARSRFRNRAAPATMPTAAAAPVAAAAAAAASGDQAAATRAPHPAAAPADAAIAGPEGPSGTTVFAPAAMPEMAVDTKAAAAQSAAASAALDAAQDTNAVMLAFQNAPPSLKAREAGRIGDRTAKAASGEQARFNGGLQTFEARMTGSDTLPAAAAPVSTPALPVTAPLAQVAAPEAAAPAPAPAVAVDPTPDPVAATANADSTEFLKQFFSVGDVLGLGRSFDQVETTDEAVDTSAGVRPTVPLTKETNPGQLATQQTGELTQATNLQGQAARAVVQGPGPERAQLRDMQQSFTPAVPRDPVLATPAAAPQGADAFAAKPLDAETVAIFDQYHAEPMRASLDGAHSAVDQAVSTRDTGRTTEMTKAETKQADLNAKADVAQRTQVSARRQDIRTARQSALDAQTGRVADMRTEADAAHAVAQTEIDTKVKVTETDVAKSFDTAEVDAQAKVDKGHEDAEAKRKASEKEAENASWWDRAWDWVADQFHKLVAFINSIFDKVRAAVKGIINAVKKAALALIDLAATAIKSAIKAFGAILHLAVNALFSKYFPEIADALNGAIDTAVDKSTKAVDFVADGLKAGISMLLDALAAGLDAILAVYQAAVNAGLALVEVALTGDWAALAKAILTPILNFLGIDPEAFFTMLAHAAQALDIIVDDPLGFVSNLIDTLKGGISLFADNFPRHLLVGILIWLTGPLGAGIIMPQQFDLWGLLDIARQVFGLTVDMVRRVATRVLGVEAVARIEFVMTYVTALITGGWRGLWDQLSADLGMVRDMVLDQIKTFLVDKVVMASITWLASLFSPVGALVKLVLTIWNFIQFLRTQLARIFQIAEAVITTIWEIATGALERPIKGVEAVLGQLIPVVLDLLARLIPVSGIPDKVQQVLKAVRERIEKGLEKLMRRVADAMGIATKGGEAGAPGQIMAPIEFSSGGETHTILIADEGETVRPMIRSTPTPLATWLDGRMGAPFTKLAEEKSWKGATLAQNRTTAQDLVTAALAEEAGLDAKAEAAEDKINAAAATGATDKVKAEAAAKVQETQMKGEQTKSAVTQVLKFWGISVVPLAEKFKAEIAVMQPDLRVNFSRFVLPGLDAARYAVLSWDQVSGQLARDGGLTSPWRQPANSTGIGRRLKGDAFTLAIVQKAKAIAIEDPLPGAEGFLGGKTTNKDEVNRLFGDFLAERLNRGAPLLAILHQFLLPEVASYLDLAETLKTPIGEAVRRMCDPRDELDSDIKSQISGSTYFEVFEDAARAQTRVFTFYQTQKPDGSPGGPGVAHPLRWFLEPNPAKSPDLSSPRNGPNRARVSDAIRDARPGMHEWIPASIAYTAITATANSFKTRGNLDAASGVANFVEFQNKVRTPTTDLVFKPNSFAEVTNAKLPYVSRLHHLSGKPYGALTTEEKDRFYPKDHGPKYSDPVPVLQAHAGGLRARAGGDSALGWTYAQDASPRWHINLQEQLTTVVGTNVEMRALGEIRRAILSFYVGTIWSGKTDLPQRSFDVYQLSGGAGDDLTYDALKGRSAGLYQQTYSDLVTAMNEVLDS